MVHTMTGEWNRTTMAMTHEMTKYHSLTSSESHCESGSEVLTSAGPSQFQGHSSMSNLSPSVSETSAFNPPVQRPVSQIHEIDGGVRLAGGYPGDPPEEAQVTPNLYPTLPPPYMDFRHPRNIET